MKVARGLAEWKVEGAAVATVGNFDGVHVAHRQLLAAVRAEAAERGAAAVAVSFEPHPNRILRPQTAPPLITPLEEKVRRIAETGVGHLLLLAFTRDLSLLTPREFAQRILVEGLGVAAVHEGENFRFGHRHAGDTGTLQQLGEALGFRAVIHRPVVVRGETVSSSRIRELVAAGEVARARPLLGRAFAVRGLIAGGRGVGREQTVPTLNLQHYEELLPGHGVYLSETQLGETRYRSLTNVGVRPTFGESGAVTVESYILDPPAAGLRAEVGSTMEVRFLRRLREERKFATPAALRTQILADAAAAEVYFGRLAAARRVTMNDEVRP